MLERHCGKRMPLDESGELRLHQPEARPREGSAPDGTSRFM